MMTKTMPTAIFEVNLVMLQFIFGRAGFGKTAKVQELLLEAASENVDKLMLIVPEQSSFDTEKAVLDVMGAKKASKVRVMTFTRLVDLFEREFGAMSGTRINKADRNLLMSLAVDEVADKLEVYASQVDKPEFVELMVSALSEFKMCHVTCESLFGVLARVNEPNLRSKLEETALIFEAYEAILSNIYIDPLDDLTRLTEAVAQHRFFHGYTVFFDGFDGFTVQQLGVIEAVLQQCERCYISLCGDKMTSLDDSFDLFSSVNKTANCILGIAKKNFVTIKAPIYLTKARRFEGLGLSCLEANIFRARKEELREKVDDVVIFSGTSKYDEADFVCRTIKRLICSGDYKYSDFAVITRNEEVYRGVMDACFEKFEITYFMDKREEIDTKPLMQVVLMALEIACSGFASEHIFKYLKTGLTGFSIDEVAQLENYVLFWSITGKRWLTEFTSNPDGYSKMSEASEEILRKLNKLRERVISPLARLRESLIDSTGDAMVQAVYEFLESIGIVENLQVFCEDLNAGHQCALAEEQPRLWDLLVEIFDRMAIILKGKKMGAKRFMRLLRLAIGSYDIAFAPRGVDEVTFGSIDRIRASNIKVAFLLGAVEGEFPRVPASSGVFSDAQRRQLISMGLPLYDSLEGLSLNERFLAYKAITIPSQRLFITWSCATTLGGSKAASAIVRETKFILPRVRCIDGLSLRLEDEIWAKQPTFEICAEHWSDKSRFSQTLRHYFEGDGGYKEKIDAIEKAVSSVPFKLNDSRKIRALFGEDLKISASQVEKFYLCRFAYFCKYALLAKERKKARFNALEYGNIIHFVFEKVLKNYTLEKLLEFSEAETLSAINEILGEYVKKNLGGWSDKTHRFRYLFERVASAAVPLVDHMASELSQSRFIPSDFELELSEKGSAKPLKLQLPDGSSIVVDGKVDRVDVMRHDGKNYVRVVDYKTGAKKFNLSDVLYGLNLQMLIYLEALCANAHAKYGKIVPAGVLYLPSISSVLSLDRDEDAFKLEKEKLRQLRMNGLILDDLQVIFGMEHDAKGLYIPVVVKDEQSKSSESLASVAELGAIMQHVDRLLVDMALELRDGDIAAQPAKGTYDACEFCEYAPVCAPLRDENARKIEDFKREEFFEKLGLCGGEEND